MNGIKLTCQSCGKEFLFTPEEQDFYKKKGFSNPKRCKACRAKRKEEKKKLEQDQATKLENEKIEKLSHEWQTAEMANLNVDGTDTLYIIGNGFDIMHGVHSSYYDFQKTLGKRNPLRFALETYLDTESLWSDFEAALGCLNVDMMCNYDVLDMWLDSFDAYDSDAQAADYCMAVDAATGPASTITDELPRRFRMWVESLKLEKMDKPLYSIVKNSPTLNFNYTEFIETLYGTHEENVCYIHGCRKKKKYQPKEKLILGHRPDASDNWEVHPKKKRHKDPYKQYILESAQDAALNRMNWYDDATVKNCKNIIASHEDFFNKLTDIKMIAVIGHSLASVDWDYFHRIIEVNRNRNGVEWLISFHSSKDLENLKKFVDEMGVEKGKVTIFRT